MKLVQKFGSRFSLFFHQFFVAQVLGLHMSMDPVLLDACGDVLAAQFAGVTKVLTGALGDTAAGRCFHRGFIRERCNSQIWYTPKN